MNNYYYIVASLPYLKPDGDHRSFLYEKVREEILSQLSNSDRALTLLFEEGIVGDTIDEKYYKKVLSCKNKFIREYFAIDLAIRNAKVESVARALFTPQEAKKKIETYTVTIDNPLDTRDVQNLRNIFAGSNILKKEKELDDFRWEKINAITILDFFNIDIILAFLAKGKLVQRWNTLDEQKGRELFRRLVDEVRGTYDKNKLSYTDEN